MSITYILAFVPITITEIGSDVIVATKSIVAPYHPNDPCMLPRLLAALIQYQRKQSGCKADETLNKGYERAR